MLYLINTCEQDPEMLQLLDGGRNSLPTLHSRFQTRSRWLPSWPLHTWMQTGSKCYGGHEGPNLLQQEEMHLTSLVQWILTKYKAGFKTSLNRYVKYRYKYSDSISGFDTGYGFDKRMPSVNMSGVTWDVILIHRLTVCIDPQREKVKYNYIIFSSAMLSCFRKLLNFVLFLYVCFFTS